MIADRVLASNRTTADGKGDAPAVDNESVYLKGAESWPYESYGGALQAVEEQ